MPFLLTSSYKFISSSSFVEIGLFTARHFEPVAAFSGYEEDFLILNFNEYTQFTKVLTSCSAFFTSDPNLLAKEQFPSQNIAEFTLDFEVAELILRVRNNTQCFRVTRATWIDLCNFRDILALKFNVLEKYSIYARLLYSRFVNFLSQQQQQQQQNTSQGSLANELLLYAPTSIIPEHKYVRVDPQHFDPTICLLLDAEIRLYCLDDVFRDSKTLRENESVTFSTYFTRLWNFTWSGFYRYTMLLRLR